MYRYWLVVPKSKSSYSSEFDAGKPVTATEAWQLMKASKQFYMSRIKKLEGYDHPLKDFVEKTGYIRVSFDVKVDYKDPRGMNILKAYLEKDPGYRVNWRNMIIAKPISESIRVTEIAECHLTQNQTR